VREIIRFTAEEARPAPSQVLRTQGLPEGEALPARLQELLEWQFVNRAAPRRDSLHATGQTPQCKSAGGDDHARPDQ